MTLPKFKLESQFELCTALRTLGVDELFDDRKANLSNISGNHDLYVSAVIHKAFIEVRIVTVGQFVFVYRTLSGTSGQNF